MFLNVQHSELWCVGRSIFPSHHALAKQDLGGPRAFDVKSGTSALVAGLDFFSAGFSCKSRSRLSSKSSSLVGCCQTGEGETGSTWNSVRDYINRALPAMIMLENVTDLVQHKEGDVDDAAFVVTTLSEMGYAARLITVEAASHGSFAFRQRLYLIGYKVSPLMFDKAQLCLAELESMMTSLYLEPFPESDFICEDLLSLHWHFRE